MILRRPGGSETRSTLAKAEVAGVLGADELLTSLSDWLAVFHCLARAAEQRKGLVVVLDEFPYLVDADPALPSVVQKFWDSGAARAGNLKLMLCGSIISQTQELLAERNPLYGRKTLALDLCPLPFRDAAQFIGRYTADEKVMTFAVFGGTPFYLKDSPRHYGSARPLNRELHFTRRRPWYDRLQRAAKAGRLCV